MTWVRDRLLKELPSSFDRDPHPIPGLALAYDGGAWVTVARRQIAISVQGGTGESITLSLEGKTLTQVAADISAHVGYAASVVATDGSLSATSLVEVSQQNISQDARFSCFTSLLWRVLVPLSWALYDGVDIQERSAQQSASIWGAEETWLNYWGELYGDAKRKPLEADSVFALRIIREILRPKLNALAIEDIIEEDLGVRAQVFNLYKKAWEVGTTRKGWLAGRRYSRTTFEVIVSNFVEGLRTTVNRVRAAGTLPFYRYQISQGQPETGYASIVPTITSPKTLLSRYAWVVGRDRCHELPIGGKHLSLFEKIDIVPQLESYLNVPAGVLGDPLILSAGMLGVNVLGNPSDAGILLSEGTFVFTEVGVDIVEVVFEDLVTGDFYLVSFGVTIDKTPTTGPGEQGWLIQTGWWLGIWNGILDTTQTPIAGAVSKDVAVDLSVVNGVLVYTPSM